MYSKQQIQPIVLLLKSWGIMAILLSFIGSVGSAQSNRGLDQQAPKLVQGSILELVKSASNIWIDKEHCNHSSSCDALLIEGATVKTRNGQEQLPNLILMNEYFMNCQNSEPEGWGLKALVYAFSPRETWPSEDRERIESVVVSELTAREVFDVSSLLVSISPNKNQVQGRGFLGKLEIKVVFKTPQSEPAEIEDLCRQSSEEQLSFKEKVLVYGGTLK